MEKIIATEIAIQGYDSELLNYLEQHEDDLELSSSIVYYGFPVFKDYEDVSVKSKLVILSKKHGIILLYSTDTHQINNDDENLSQLYNFIEASLKKSKIIRVNKRKLHIPIESYLYSESAMSTQDDLENDLLTTFGDIHKLLAESTLENQLEESVFNESRAIIEGSKALSRLSKRTETSDNPKKKSNILIKLENEISNFDVEQRKIAISLISGPQRIRGLAGSGKTVVLAMKAAHIHLQHPKKKILFTFYTKSLYGLIKEMISRFYRHFSGDEPNWEFIHVLHSWGGRTIDGVCFNTCNDNSIANISFSQAKQINPSDPFKIVCSHIESHNIFSKYDYILIDEAQDLPNEFFQLCYKLAIGEEGYEKNIIWAYDDLQSIFNVYQRTPKELFGVNDDSTPKIDLNKFKARLNYGQSNDLVLYKCYRNPLEVLITAHALGFGLYSEQQVQMLENEEHWRDVGYTVDENQEFTTGQTVKIKRERENSPLSIYEHQNSTDIIECYKATSMEDECQWIANKIALTIEEGLKPHDILVISLDDKYARGYFTKISYFLSEKDIRSNNLLTSHAVAPPFILENMVTLSTVHRAKGNEAPMVFAAGIDAIFPQRDFQRGRNKIFTAFTRTKAWLRVSGVGEKANLFFNEITKSISNSPYLIFEVPDAQQIQTIQRDLSAKPQEMMKLHELVSDLMEKGYSEEEIQEELKLVSKGKENE